MECSAPQHVKTSGGSGRKKVQLGDRRVSFPATVVLDHGDGPLPCLSTCAQLSTVGGRPFCERAAAPTRVGAECLVV